MINLSIIFSNFLNGILPSYNLPLIKNEGVDILEFYISIYNRLGQRVFSSNDINFSWDGNFKGMLLQPQVFDYFLEITCSGGKKLFKKGNITLIK